MKFTPFASRITGTGSAFPEKILTNKELAEKLALVGEITSDEWIRERTGIHQRRLSEPGNPREQNSSLAVVAAEKALKTAGKTVDDVDQIFYATCSPDTIVPSSGCWFQSKLGAKKAWALDINAACSGFIYGLHLANQAIQLGQAKCVLVVGSEVLSTMVNWKDRGTSILFGDGAGVFVLERAPADSPRRILSTHLLTDGSLWEYFHIPAGGSNMELTPEAYEKSLGKMVMKGKEIFKTAVKTLSDFAVVALEANGMTTSDLDWFVPHQANLRIIEAVAKRLNFPMEKVILNIDRYGNTSAATVPTAMDEAIRDGRIKSGQSVLLDVFGAGLTYGSLLVRY